MAVLTQSRVNRSLYVPDSLGPDDAIRAAYLLPAGAPGPQTLSLTAAIGSFGGWFVFTPGLTAANIDNFVAAAQVYFANSARAGAFAAWFPNADSPSTGLNGMLVYATRSGAQATVSRAALIQGANLSLNLGIGTTIAVSEDQLSLRLSAKRNSWSVTPYGARKPYQLPWLNGMAAINVLGASAASGCFFFAVTVNDTAAAMLDIGLRSYTAQAGGGDAQSASHQVFVFGASGIALSVALDPLALLDHTRSYAAFAASQPALASTWRSAVGAPLSLTPAASASLVFGNRLLAVDANGKPVVLPSNRIVTMTPSGGFSVSCPQRSIAKQSGGTPNLSATLMCGLSAVEYLDVDPAAMLTFIPDQPAFAPTLKEASGTGPGDTRRVFGPLTAAGQTSWAYLSAQAGSRYFAQPDSSVLHNGAGDASAPFLNYLPVQLGTLPPAPLPSAVAAEAASGYPLLPYAAVTVAPGLSAEDLAQFEYQAWAPARKALIQRFIGSANPRLPPTAQPLPVPPYGTTPQGLLLAFGQGRDGLAWAHLTLGNSPSAAPAYRSNTVVLSDVDGPLKEALQSNQLALIIASGGHFAACGSFPYLLTQERYQTLQATIADEAVTTAIAPLVVGGSAGSGMWPNEAALNASLHGVLTQGQFDTWAQTIRSYTGDFSLFVADWEFDLSPWRWTDHNSILIFKFCNKQLTQVVADTSQWTQADAFNGAATGTQAIIAGIFQDAAERLAAGNTDLGYFVNTVMHDPNWNGILVLNAEVPLAGLPPQLEGLAAGIDASKFQAHHLGITVTPVVTGATTYTTTASSAFGLIDYSSPAPLVSNQPYDFKVLSLKVLIANSDIASFSSSVELLINQLFGEPATQQSAPNNNLLLYGTYQKSGGVGSYAFTSNGTAAYQMSSSTLYMVNIETASFITVTNNANDPDNTTTLSRFLLAGSVSFLPQPGFDLFSFGPEQAVIDSGGSGGGLVYSALSIDMTFDQATPTYRAFDFNATKIGLNQSASLIRAQSLAAHFPMRLMGLIQASGDTTPEKIGFMPVDSPIQGSALTAPWFGLQFELDLGSLGALAAEAGFSATLLLGWAPNLNGATNYIGLSMPGVSGGDRAISLQGVLRLVFGDVTFLVQPPTYILQLQNIALSFLNLSFPPNGQINLLMFGNPDAPTSGALGWYAAYLKNGAGGDAGDKQNGIGRLKQTAPEQSLLIAPQHQIKKWKATE